jgi:hypothetical protein
MFPLEAGMAKKKKKATARKGRGKAPKAKPKTKLKAKAKAKKVKVKAKAKVKVKSKAKAKAKAKKPVAAKIAPPPAALAPPPIMEEVTEEPLLDTSGVFQVSSQISSSQRDSDEDERKRYPDPSLVAPISGGMPPSEPDDDSEEN